MSEGMPGLVPREPSRSPCLGDDDKRRYNGQCNPYACRLSALGPACDRKRQMAGTMDSDKFMCPVCGLEKMRHEFGTHAKGNRMTHCIACRAENERQVKERAKARNTAWKSAWRAKRQREEEG